MASMATEASEKVQKSLKTGDLMLSKGEGKIEGVETKTQWLPVRLGNHNGGVLLIRMDGCYVNELVDGEPSIYKGVRTWCVCRCYEISGYWNPEKNLSDFGIQIVNLSTDANPSPLHHSCLCIGHLKSVGLFMYRRILFCITS